jgi:hypothetical protein
MSEQYKRPEQPKHREFTVDELVPYWERIVEAIQAAPPDEEWQVSEDSHDDTEGAYIKGEAGRENLDKRGAQPHVVKFPDFETLMATFSANEVLSRLLPEEQIRAMIEHERAHLDEAKKHGYDTEIGLSVTQTPDSRYAFTPFVTVSVDLEAVDEAEVRKHLQDIGRAPGHDVSDSDKRKF